MEKEIKTVEKEVKKEDVKAKNNKIKEGFCKKLRSRKKTIQVEM